jgi:hypothetical protein
VADQHVREARRLPGPEEGAEVAPGRPDRPGEGLRPARPRWRRLPDRAEVVVHPAERRQAALPGGQRRRGRAGYLQGPADDDERSARADRGHRHHLLRDPGRAGVHLHPRRGGARRAAAAARGRRGVRAGLPGPQHPRYRPQRGAGRAQRRRRVHLRRGDGAAGLAGGLPRPAAAEAAVPGDARALLVADRREQRRHDRLRAVHRARRRRLVAHDGYGEVVRPDDLLAVRPGREPGPVRVHDGHHAAGAAGAVRRHAAGPRAEVLDAGRIVDAAVHRRAPGRPAGLRLRGGAGLDARHHRDADLLRPGLPGLRHVPVDRVLRARVVRQVHAVPRGQLLDGPDPPPDPVRPGQLRRPRHPAGRLRQPAGPVVLRAGRRRDLPGHLVHQVLQAGLPGLHRGPQEAPARRSRTRGSART